MEKMIEERLNICEKSIQETFEQIKMLQNRHQQLIGYKQGVTDILNDLKTTEEQINLQQSVEIISSKKKQPAA
jgi:hypothetical protein